VKQKEEIIRDVSINILIATYPNIVDIVDSLWSVFNGSRNDDRLISKNKAQDLVEANIQDIAQNKKHDIDILTDAMIVFSIVQSSLDKLEKNKDEITSDNIWEVLSSESKNAEFKDQSLLGPRHKLKQIGYYWINRYLDGKTSELILTSESGIQGSESGIKDQSIGSLQYMVYEGWKDPEVLGASDLDRLRLNRSMGKYRISIWEPLCEVYRLRMKLARPPERRLMRLLKGVFRNCHNGHMPLIDSHKELWPEFQKVNNTIVIERKDYIRKAFWKISKEFKGYPHYRFYYDDPYPRVILEKNFNYCLVEPLLEGEIS